MNGSCGHIQRAKQLLEEELAANGLHAESPVAILGSGELAPLVYLTLKHLGIGQVDIFDANEEDPSEMLTGAWLKLAFRLDDYDRVVLASLGDTETKWRNFKRWECLERK